MTKITLPPIHYTDIIQRIKNNYQPAELAQDLIRDLYYIAPIYPEPEKIKTVSIKFWIAIWAVLTVFLIGFIAVSVSKPVPSPSLGLVLPFTLACATILSNLVKKQKNEVLDEQSKSYCGLTKDAIIFIDDQALRIKGVFSDASYQLQPPTFIQLDSCTALRTEDAALAIYTNKVKPIRLYFAAEDQPIFKKYFLHLMAVQNYEIFDADK